MISRAHNEFKFFNLNLKKNTDIDYFKTLFEINKRFLVERYGKSLKLKKSVLKIDEDLEVNDMALDIISSVICGPTKIILSEPENIQLILSKIEESYKSLTNENTKKIYEITIKNLDNILKTCREDKFIDKFPNFNYPDDSSTLYHSSWKLPLVSFETIDVDEDWEERFYEYMESHFEFIGKLYNKDYSNTHEIEAYHNFAKLVTFIKNAIQDGHIKLQYVATKYGPNKDKDNSIGMYINQIDSDETISLTNDKRCLTSLEKIYSIKNPEEESNNLSFIQEVFLHTI